MGVSKQHIYQYFTFSRNKVAVRSIPRLFVFDCCDGQYAPDRLIRCIVESNESKIGGKPSIVPQNGNENQFKVEWERPWPDKEHNPDHNLVVIHGANRGFQSHATKGYGSYLIHFLTKSLTKSLDQKCRRRICGPRYLGQIMDEIQQVLEEKERQLVVPVYINHTDRIVFRPGKDGRITNLNAKSDGHVHEPNIGDSEGNEKADLVQSAAWSTEPISVILEKEEEKMKIELAAVTQTEQKQEFGAKSKRVLHDEAQSLNKQSRKQVVKPGTVNAHVIGFEMRNIVNKQLEKQSSSELRVMKQFLDKYPNHQQ